MRQFVDPFACDLIGLLNFQCKILISHSILTKHAGFIRCMCVEGSAMLIMFVVHFRRLATRQKVVPNSVLVSHKENQPTGYQDVLFFDQIQSYLNQSS